MASLMPVAKQQYFIPGTTIPLVGGKLYTYQAGTSIPMSTFQDAAGTIPNTNPITLDSTGSALIYWSGNYKVVLKDVLGNTIYTVDNYNTDPQGLLQIFTQAGASLIGFILGSANAIKTTIQNKLRERPSLLDFMTDAQRADVLNNVGSIDVSAAVQAAIDAYVDPVAPAGTYLINMPLHVTSDLHLKGKKRKTIFRKTSATADAITRTYVDNNGVTQTLNWNLPVVFNLVCPTNSYLTDVNIDGISFDLPADCSVGAFHGQRVSYSSFRNLFSNNSSFFAKGYDMFEILWENIRSRYSTNHWLLDTGTSHVFINTAADIKNPNGGSGYVLSNLYYCSMYGTAADSLDSCYEFNNAQVAMHGCGAESFSRLIRARGGSVVAIHGGALKVFKNAGLTGTYTPYEFDDPNTQVTMNGTWLGVADPADPGGTYAQMAITNGAQVTLNNIRNPVELSGGPSNWWYVTGTGSLLTQIDPSGVRYTTPNGPSRLDAVTGLKHFIYQKTIAAGAAVSIFRMPVVAPSNGYGENFNARISVRMTNPYSDGMGFNGQMEFIATAFNETTKTQNLTLLGQSITLTNTGGGAFGGITGTLVRNADNSVDFQLNVANAPAVVSNTNVTVFVEYMTFIGTTPSANVIIGL